MTGKHKGNMESLSNDIKAMAADLRFNTGVQLLYTGLLLNKYIDMEVRIHGQNRSRLDILHTLIVHAGVLKPSDLGKMTFRSKQTVTKIIDGLERGGQVTRELVGKDRRTRRIIITEKGLETVKKNLPNTLEISNTAMPSFGEEELEQLNNILRRVRKHLISQIASATSKE